MTAPDFETIRARQARRRRLTLAPRVAHYLRRYPRLSDLELAQLLCTTPDEIRAIRDAH